MIWREHERIIPLCGGHDDAITGIRVEGRERRRTSCQGAVDRDLAEAMLGKGRLEPDCRIPGKLQLAPAPLEADLEGADGGDTEPAGVAPQGLPGRFGETLWATPRQPEKSARVE